MFAPTTFGKYYLYEQLASGGMAEIFKAKLLGPGGFEKLLVIKQIKPDLARRREFVEMFVDEAKVTVQLSHGNIVPVYELGMVDGTYFIAMEYVDGPALNDVLRAARKQGRTVAPTLAAHIAVEILKGLDYAHRQRILHRDLSPGNVLISRQGEVKIVDFGLATSEARLIGKKLVGSYAYMSPEQARNEDALDARSDLFSLGVLMWEMLVGKTLFVAEDDEQTLARVRAAEVTPPSQAGAPAELDEVLAKALAREPAQRYPRAADFQAALVRWLYSTGTLPGQDDLGRFVREMCPPPAPEKMPQPLGATPIMGIEAVKSAIKEVSFATNVTFEREVLTRAGLTPSGGTKALTRALAPARSRRAWIGAAIVVALAGSAAAAALVAHREPQAAPAPIAATPQPPPPKPRPEPAPGPERVVAPVPPTKKVAHTIKPVALPHEPEPESAQLTLNATPWADFYLDGKKLAGCPVVGHATTAGDHAVRVVCPDRQERTQAVSLAAGAREKRVFDCNQSGIPVVGQ